MYSKLRWFILLFLTGFILESHCWAASVTVAVSAVEGSAGTQVRVPVLVREAQGVGALELELTYDPSVLEAQSVEPGPILSGLVDFNVVKPGRLKIAMATSQAVNGSGELFLVMLKVLSSGQSRLGLENVAAWEQANSQEMTVSLEPGAFKTSGGAAVSSESSSLTLGLVLIVLALIILGLFFGRKLLAAKGKAGSSSGFGVGLIQQPLGTHSAMSFPVGGLRCLECGQILSLDSMFCRTCGATVKPPPATLNCRECERLMPEDSRFCPYCGKPVRIEQKPCPQCGTISAEQARFCPNCGTKLG